MRRQLIAGDEATKAKGQHAKCCGDCPWSRKSLPGWLGGSTPDEWLVTAHSDQRIECHALIGAQCAGAAIYRRNVCKSPRDPDNLVLPADRAAVFSSSVEFKAHHESKFKPRIRKVVKVTT